MFEFVVVGVVRFGFYCVILGGVFIFMVIVDLYIYYVSFVVEGSKMCLKFESFFLIFRYRLGL